jgi:hypothetical protein
MTATRGAKAFTLLVAAFVVALAAQTAVLSPVARLVPRWVLGPVLALLAVELALAFVPSLAARWAFLVQRDLFARRKRAPAIPVEVPPPPEGLRALGPVFGWYALLPALVVALDVRLALFVYTLAYARLRARESILVSLLLAGLVGGLAAGALWMMEYR